MTLEWGVLGTGSIAHSFAGHLRASETGRLVAVGSRSQGGAEAFGAEFGVAPDGRHGSYEALLADRRVRAVYVSTPHPLHEEWAVKAAAAGKHVLCEKPLGMNHAQAKRVVAAARAHGVFLMEAFMYRVHPQTAEVVRLLREGAVGEVRLVQASFGFHGPADPRGRLLNPSLGGGGILDVGCYPVSMSRLVAGVAAGKDFADPVDVRGFARLGTTGVDEWAVASLRFEGDVLAQVSTGVLLEQENVVRVFGSEGSLLVPNPWTPARDGGAGRVVVYRHGAPAREVTVESPKPLYAVEADAVAAAVAAGRTEAWPPGMTWDDTLGNMRTLDRWREAIGLVYEEDRIKG